MENLFCHLTSSRDSVLTFQRIMPPFTKQEREIVRNNPEMHYHILVRLNEAFLLETIFGMCKS